MKPLADKGLHLLQIVADALGSARRFEDALHDALWMLVRETSAERAAVVGLAGPGEFHLLGSSDDDAPVGLPVPEDHARHMGQIVASGEDRVGEEGSQTPTWCFPLRAEGETFAVLEVHARAPSDPALIALLRTAAAMMAPGIFYSDLYRTLRERQGPPNAAERELRVRQRDLAKYREFFERAGDGVAVLGEGGAVVLLNPAAQQLTGYATEGLAGRPFAEMVSSADRDAFEVLFAATLAGSPRSLFDVRLVTTSGDTIIVSMSTSLLSGRADVVVLSFRDITARRHLAEELRRTKDFLERLIDGAYDAIIASDVHGRVVLFNKVAERVFRRKAEDVVGHMTLEQLYPPDVLQRLRRRVARAAEDPEVRQEILRDEIIDAEGERIPVQISGSLIFENGEEVGTVANISDLRERLRMERQLIQTEERLVETEKQALIAELAGTTAHELNQPLTSIMGYAELLQRRVSPDDPNYRAAEVIQQESQRMAAIVRQIGRITRYETKTYVGETQILDLEKSSE